MLSEDDDEQIIKENKEKKEPIIQKEHIIPKEPIIPQKSTREKIKMILNNKKLIRKKKEIKETIINKITEKK